MLWPAISCSGCWASPLGVIALLHLFGVLHW